VQQLIEALSVKLGGFSIYLGIMLFANLFFFFRGKKKSKEATHQQTDLPLQPE
jgi:F0F1-type ATP synthase assembly protein I